MSPLPPNYRSSGLLLHATCLPSPYGIGDVGPAAFGWIDRLHDAGQGWWQALPLGPTGYGDSPYQPLSSFAGNWLLLSPEALLADGLVMKEELDAPQFSDTAVDYPAVTAFKRRMLDTVCRHFDQRATSEIRAPMTGFARSKGTGWRITRSFGRSKRNSPTSLSPTGPASWCGDEAAALANAQRRSAIQIDEVYHGQFLLNLQGARLKEHARAKNVRLIGDLPFFVSGESSNVWANPELFLLDDRCRPRFVGGVPPDYFSAVGQRWGNPVYNWEAIRQTGYRWCIDRIRALLAHVDLIRLNHFRGFAAAWHIPAEAPTAVSGQWVKGPGAEFFDAVEKAVGSLPFIAEDLGVITPDVRALLDHIGVPGTRVLQFAFDGSPDNPYLPDKYVANTVVYTGTHDNNTTRGWYEELPNSERDNLRNYLKRPNLDANAAAAALLGLAWNSRAAWPWRRCRTCSISARKPG